MDKAVWTRSVIKVRRGRGFVVHGPLYPYVITAAHCLPTDDEEQLTLPAARVVYREERTFGQMLGPLDREPTLPAKVVFVDPIADLAVLGPPDEHRFGDWALLADAQPFPIARPVVERGPYLRAYLLSLDQQWVPCEIGLGNDAYMRYSLGLTDTTPAVNILPPTYPKFGMSGSPIVLETGEAIGVVVTNAIASQPFLAQQLPVWLLDEMTLDLERDLDPRRKRMRQRLDRSRTPRVRDVSDADQ